MLDFFSFFVFSVFHESNKWILIPFKEGKKKSVSASNDYFVTVKIKYLYTC